MGSSVFASPQNWFHNFCVKFARTLSVFRIFLLDCRAEHASRLVQTIRLFKLASFARRCQRSFMSFTRCDETIRPKRRFKYDLPNFIVSHPRRVCCLRTRCDSVEYSKRWQRQIAKLSHNHTHLYWLGAQSTVCSARTHALAHLMLRNYLMFFFTSSPSPSLAGRRGKGPISFSFTSYSKWNFWLRVARAEGMECVHTEIANRGAPTMTCLVNCTTQLQCVRFHCTRTWHDARKIEQKSFPLTATATAVSFFLLFFFCHSSSSTTPTRANCWDALIQITIIKISQVCTFHPAPASYTFAFILRFAANPLAMALLAWGACAHHHRHRHCRRAFGQLILWMLNIAIERKDKKWVVFDLLLSFWNFIVSLRLFFHNCTLSALCVWVCIGHRIGLCVSSDRPIDRT